MNVYFYRVIDSVFKFNKDYKWIYYGNDYISVKKIREKLGDTNEIDYSDALRNFAEKNRDDFIEFIGELSLKYNSMKWWVSSISEKSPYNIRLLEKICFIEYINSLKYNQDIQNLIVIIGDNDLYHYFTSKKEHRINYFLLVKNKLISFIRILCKKILAAKIKRKHPVTKKEVFLIREWIQKESINSQEEINYVYFGKLIKYLKKKNIEVLLLAYIIYGKKYNHIVKRLRKEDSVILYEEVLTFLDIVNSFIMGFKSYIKFKNIVFKDIDLTKLFNYITVQEYIDPVYELRYMNYYIVKRLKKFGYNITQLLYPMENQPWEKLFCLGFRKYFPDTILKGFMFYPLSKYYTFCFISNKEKDVLPQPDILLTTGDYPAETLQRYGYNCRIVSSCALRHSYLFEKNEFKYIRSDNKKNILVLLSVDKDISYQMFDITCDKYKDSQNRIFIKPHPTVYFDYREIIDELPDNFEIITKPLRMLWNKIDEVIYTDTSACFEAVLADKNVRFINIKYRFVSNPFDFLDENICKDKAALKEFIYNSLIPPTEDKMELFLN